jgi:hypothetical protein
MINHSITAVNFTDVIVSVSIKEYRNSGNTCKVQVITERLSDNLKK